MVVTVIPKETISITFSTGYTLIVPITEVFENAEDHELETVEVINTSKGGGIMWPKLDFFMIHFIDIMPIGKGH